MAFTKYLLYARQQAKYLYQGFTFPPMVIFKVMFYLSNIRAMQFEPKKCDCSLKQC